MAEIKYCEVALNELVRYWVKDCKGYELVTVGDSFWIDTSKNKVILKLITSDEATEAEA